MNGGANATEPAHALAKLKMVRVPKIFGAAGLGGMPCQDRAGNGVREEVPMQRMTNETGRAGNYHLRKDFHDHPNASQSEPMGDWMPKNLVPRTVVVREAAERLTALLIRSIELVKI
jgi:hypothetical protein